MSIPIDRVKVDTVDKKPLYLKLSYKGEIAADILKCRLNRAIDRTFPAAKLVLNFSTKPVLTQQVKDKLPKMASSMCIYEFNCSCGASYIGRTQRALSMRAREHVPVWLSKGVTKGINSAVLAHLVDTGHPIKLDQAFSVIYRVPSNLSRGARLRLLSVAEAVAINTRRPSLCIQKKYVQPLCLPWPTIKPTNPPLTL
uniref:Uncharacterized protein n=1 Tax=Trichobilharzia regenti TaxID=157069 RepID=A0AA85IQI2_TRIRE|nr:unnamed protein product [Trichobilharzia regenti]